MINLFKDLQKGIIVGMGIMLSVGLIGATYAALSSLTVNSTDTLTSDLWNNLVDHSVPSGFVGAFNLASCPTGWSAADGTNSTPDLRGTFIRGMNGDANTRDVARTLGDYQADNFLSHLHSVNPPATSSGNQSANHVHSVNPPAKTTTSNGSHRHASSATSAFSALSFDNNDDGRRKDGANDGSYTGYAGTHAHTVDIGAFNSAGNNVSHTHSTDIAAFNSASTGGTETRPKNVALLYCVKD